MTKSWLTRIFGRSLSAANSSFARRTRLRRIAERQGTRAAEILESRQLLTLFVVNSLSDNAADISGTADGRLSLREAIIAANTNSAFGDAAAGAADGDQIVFSDALAGGTIFLENGEFPILDDVNITIGGAGQLTLDAGGASRVFRIDTQGSAGSSHRVVLAGLNLVNGAATAANGMDGGALLIGHSENVLLSALTISDSQAERNGGGIATGNGQLILDNVMLDSNTAGGSEIGQGGGGIFNAGGSLTILNGSVISNNTADGAAGSGGGIFSTAGSVSITNTNLTFNAANRAGGGIEVVDGMLSLTSTNLINNSVSGDAGTPAPGNGGGLHVTGSADVAISGGTVFGNLAAREGGGLWNSTGTLTITNGTLLQGNVASGNAADDGGGAIFNNGGTVIIDGTMSPVVITANIADGVLGSGGGIFNNAGSVTVRTSTINDNHASRAGGGVESALGTVMVIGSTLNGNVTESNPGRGGGLHLTGAGSATFVNSTISGNAAADEGGGLWNSSTGSLTIRNSTITGNTTGIAGNGGGIRNTGGVVSLTNTIVAGNTSGSVSQADDIGGLVSSDGQSNLVGSAATSGGLVNGTNGNITGIGGVGTRPLAQILNLVLADNGGSVATHMLAIGSVAIDAGVNLSGMGVVADQRGVARPRNAAFDIGAVEAEVTRVTGRVWHDLNGDGVRLPQSLVQLGFFADAGKFYFNSYGGQEKWVRAANRDWYFIRPDGSLTKWDNTRGQLTGTVVNQLPKRFYADEYLLIEAVSEPFVNGTTIELLNAAGMVVDTTTTMDRDLNNNGMIDPETERGVYEFSVLVSGVYSIREVTAGGFVQSAGPTSTDALSAYQLDQSRQLNYTGNFHTNFGGRGENWLRQSSGWVYILPDGAVYQWDNTSGGSNGLVTGTLLQQLNPAYHANPLLLAEAVNPQLSLMASNTVAGPQFGNYIPAVISGRVFEDVNQDGVRNGIERYRNGRTVQLLDRDRNVVAQVRTADVDSDGTPGINPLTERGVYQFTGIVPGRYTVRQVLTSGSLETSPASDQFAELAYRVDQQFRLRFTGNYFENFGTNQERFLFSDQIGGWVYLTKTGELFRWNPASGPRPVPLRGSLIARFDATYYTDPSRLFNARATSVKVASQEIRPNYDFGYFDIDSVFGDSGLFG